MADPNSPDEWFALVRQHERAAKIMANDKMAAAQGHWHAGIAVECALKAYIMHIERLNSWPSKQARPELYTHDVRALATIAGLVMDAKDPLAPSWAVVLQWDRGQGYDPKSMPRKFAASMIEAVFGQQGVVTWLRSSCRTNI